MASTARAAESTMTSSAWMRAGDVVQHFRLRVIGLNDENDAHEMTFSIRTTKTHAATRNVNR